MFYQTAQKPQQQPRSGWVGKRREKSKFNSTARAKSNKAISGQLPVGLTSVTSDLLLGKLNLCLLHNINIINALSQLLKQMLVDTKGKRDYT